jgi:uncharacterized protein (DUF924 family)
MDQAEYVLRFWFPERLTAAELPRQMEWWFRGGANAEIAVRFPSVLEEAASGRLDHWSRTPRSRLALIVVLDQFSRGMHAGTARAYANDSKAMALTLEGVSGFHYAALNDPFQKTFFFLPLGHSEDLRNQELAVKLADELFAKATPELRDWLAFSASQARGHRDVIARFGRHPHRNQVLGRVSTPEEAAYLERGEFVHTRDVPPHLRLDQS